MMKFNGENIDVAKDIPAAFQYGKYDHLNSEDLVQEVVQGTIKQFMYKRHTQNYVEQHTLFGLNESSESDSEEDFQDGISLLWRT